MSSTQAILAALPRSALRHLLASFDLVATDARKTDSLCQALKRGLPRDAALWLNKLPAAALREAAEVLALSGPTKTKAALVARFAAALDAGRSRAAAKPKPAASSPKEAEASTKAKTKRGAAKQAAVATGDAQPAAPTGSTSKRPTRAAGQRATSEPQQSHLYAVAGDAGGGQAVPRSKGKATAKTKLQVAQEPGADEAPAAAPAGKPAAKAAPRHMLSWTEAVALATKRGQSAASMIGQPAAATDLERIACPHCQGQLNLQPCQIHACDHRFIAQPSRKICAECMFERNNISVDAFHDRLQEDWTCAHCERAIPRP